MGSTFFSLFSLLVLIPGFCAGLDWKHEFNGNQYAVVEKAVTWYGGSLQCMFGGGYLASIKLDMDNKLMRSITHSKGGDFWIGKIDLPNKPSENRDKPFSFSGDVRGPNCPYYSSDLWFYDFCWKQHGYICQRKIPVSSNPPNPPRHLEEPGVCPRGWVDGGTDNCYRIFDNVYELLPWASARRRCLFITKYNGGIASPKTKSELDVVRKMISTRPNHEKGSVSDQQRTDPGFSPWWKSFGERRVNPHQNQQQDEDPECRFMFDDLTRSPDMLTHRCHGKYKGFICEQRKRYQRSQANLPSRRFDTQLGVSDTTKKTTKKTTTVQSSSSTKVRPTVTPTIMVKTSKVKIPTKSTTPKPTEPPSPTTITTPTPTPTTTTTPTPTPTTITTPTPTPTTTTTPTPTPTTTSTQIPTSKSSTAIPTKSPTVMVKTSPTKKATPKTSTVMLDDEDQESSSQSEVSTQSETTTADIPGTDKTSPTTESGMTSPSEGTTGSGVSSPSEGTTDIGVTSPSDNSTTTTRETSTESEASTLSINPYVITALVAIITLMNVK